MAVKEFNINVEMEERWIPHSMSMLKEMERCGHIGTSRIVSMFADGDGDFRPKFKADIDFEQVEPRQFADRRIYDAG